MWNNKKNKAYVILLAGLLFVFSLWAWLKPTDDYSESERRPLDDFPEFTLETVLSGDFMTEFESYTLDQFPLRDTFRSLKSMASLYLFRQSDVNDLYIHDGYLAKAEYPLSETMLDIAGDKFWYLYDSYMTDTDVNLYFSIVPDKNYYLSPEAGQLSMDYSTLVSSMTEKTSYMEYIDLFSLLKLSNYHPTDGKPLLRRILRSGCSSGSTGYPSVSDKRYIGFLHNYQLQYGNACGKRNV